MIANWQLKSVFRHGWESRDCCLNLSQAQSAALRRRVSTAIRLEGLTGGILSALFGNAYWQVPLVEHGKKNRQLLLLVKNIAVSVLTPQPHSEILFSFCSQFWLDQFVQFAVLIILWSRHLQYRFKSICITFGHVKPQICLFFLSGCYAEGWNENKREKFSMLLQPEFPPQSRDLCIFLKRLTRVFQGDGFFFST